MCVRGRGGVRCSIYSTVQCGVAKVECGARPSPGPGPCPAPNVPSGPVDHRTTRNCNGDVTDKRNVWPPPVWCEELTLSQCLSQLPTPESMSCSLPAELTDPPPSPPPRYISSRTRSPPHTHTHRMQIQVPKLHAPATNPLLTDVTDQKTTKPSAREAQPAPPAPPGGPPTRMGAGGGATRSQR